MPRVKVLNRGAAEPSLEPVALSRRILEEAQALTGPEQCARLDRLTGQLRHTDPASIGSDASRIAFWANLYNALLLHCLCLKPLRGSILMHLRMFGRTAYEVGGREYSLDVIEHGLLRENLRPPLRPRRLLRGGDPRLAAAPSRPDPRIHFALNCGALSCPPVRAYEPETLDEQLEAATRAYLAAETRLDPERRRATLPRLMRIYRADFGDRRSQLRFVAHHLPEVEARLSSSSDRLRVRYGRFDWTAIAPSSS
jgi:hypothetical protein